MLNAQSVLPGCSSHRTVGRCVRETEVMLNPLVYQGAEISAASDSELLLNRVSANW